MSKPISVIRFNHKLKALQINSDHLDEAALWCGGKIVVRFGNLRAIQVKDSFAYDGDWIVKVGPVFLVYTDYMFKKTFRVK